MPSYEDYPSPSTELLESSSSSELGHLPASDLPSPHSSFELSPDKTGHQDRTGNKKRAGKEAREDGEGSNRDGDGDGDGDADAPSHVLRALELLRAKCYGQPLDLEQDEGDWLELEGFSPVDYDRFRRDLDLDPRVARHFTDKVRHDYDPTRRILVLRHLMPSSTHDVFTSKLVDHVKRWLDGLKTQWWNSDALEDVISRITFGSTSDLEIKVPQEKLELLPSEPGSRPKTVTYKYSPDGQFHYLGHKNPPFVVEIGYSQKRKDLAKLAKRYYEQTNGRIKTVLTVDLEYVSRTKRKEGQGAQRSKEASFSLYRGNERVVQNQLFRNDAGEVVQSNGINLYLNDLVPDNELERLVKDPGKSGQGERNSQGGDGGQCLDQAAPLLISPQHLFDALIKSEAFQEDRDRTNSPSPPPQTPATGLDKKRKVKWELEEEEEDNDNDDEQDEQELPAKPSSASSKRWRLSPESRTYASPRRSSLQQSGPLQRTSTRSQSRASQKDA